MKSKLWNEIRVPVQVRMLPDKKIRIEAEFPEGIYFAGTDSEDRLEEMLKQIIGYQQRLNILHAAPRRIQ
ncbi:MAG: hypothetical protein ABFD76_05080 [Smithella sp.]